MIYKRNMQTMINLIASIVSMVVSLSISFFLSPYIVETLGAEANGFTQLANNFITYATLITLALNSMGARFISICYHKNDLKTANKYYSSIIIGNIIIVLVLVVPAILCVYKLENIIAIEENFRDVKILFAFTFLNFFISQITSAFGIATFVTNKLYLSNIVTIIKSLLNGLFLVILFLIFNPKIYFVSLVAVILTVINSIAILKIKNKILKDIKFDKHNFDWKSVKILISSGIWNTINQSGNILMTGFDLLVANIFISPVQMGILSVAKSIPGQIMNLSSVVNSNFAPSFTISVANENQSELLKNLRFAMRISTLFMSIPIIVFCVFAQEFYLLWMPTLDARQLTIISFLTCMAFIPASGTQALNNILTATNKLKLNSVTFLLTGFINISVVFILLKFTSLELYAIAGVSSILTIIRHLGFTLPYVAFILNFKWYIFYRDTFISLGCALLCTIVSYIIKLVIIPNTWFLLIVCVFIACIACFLAEILILLNKNERANLINKIFRRIKKNG